MRKMIAICFAFLLSVVAVAQNKSVTGKVIDEYGEPLIGASVLVKGTKHGVATDLDGNYSLLNVKTGDVIVVSFTGYKTREEKVGKGSILNITLSPAVSELGDVVLVGQGVKKKVAVSGAISSVKGGELRLPSSSLVSSFAGQIAGVVMTSASGQPGSIGDFYIRGISTFGGRTTPLIILDDVEISAGDLNRIPPETIESFSVLKDASATAIYGSRGANGVMVVKTKTGKRNERTQIGVTVENSIVTPGSFPKFVDGATWMELYNEALLTRNEGATPRYSQEEIERTRSGINPYVYPNVNWEDALFKNMAMNQRANINVSGGGSKVAYYMSIQANHDMGHLNTKKVYSYNNQVNNWTYTFQNNLNYELLQGTNLELKMNAQIFTKESPDYVNLQSVFTTILKNNPVNYPVVYPAQEGDRHIRFGSSVVTGTSYKENPYNMLLNTYRLERANTLNTSLKLNQKLDFITKGLSGSLLYNFKNYSQAVYRYKITPYYYQVKNGSYNPENQTYELELLGQPGDDYLKRGNTDNNSDQTLSLQAKLDYNRKVGENHTFSGMLLYHQKETRSDILPHRNQGVSGRVEYDFKHRYFAEVNFGYTGTERLEKGNRFEFFPAVSAGWVVSDEEFFKPVSKYLNFLKLRASYGLTGSDEGGGEHFYYLDNIQLEPNDKENTKYWTGEELNHSRKGPRVAHWATPLATWEKSRKFNLGVDLKLLKGDLDVSVEYFTENRYDIMMQRIAWPNILGYQGVNPWANKGKIDSRGYEISANYSKKVNDNLTVGAKFNLTYAKNQIVDNDDLEYDYPWLVKIGKPMSDFRYDGYIADGLFTSQEEIDNSPVQNLGSNVKPGDIKYRDVNGDGQIDINDQVMISEYGKKGRLHYGFGVNAVYKKWDFNIFFNGIANRTINLSSFNASPFGRENASVFQFIADNRWTESNPNPNASFPRLGLQDTDRGNNSHNSTYWLRDGSFLRLKNIELGYTFKRGRVFLSGSNLAVFSKFKQWDPESNWDNYPLLKVYNLGVQLRF